MAEKSRVKDMKKAIQNKTMEVDKNGNASRRIAKR
jgi:hypothetical protein